MGSRGRNARKRERYVFCDRCKLLIAQWPSCGAIVENESGTQEMKVCLKCLDFILNLKGVQVVKSNVNRG